MAITTQQEYIDELFVLQCCISELANCIVEKKQIGQDVKSIEKDYIKLHVYYETLLDQNIENENCLTKEDTLSLLEKTKILCKTCSCSG